MVRAGAGGEEVREQRVDKCGLLQKSQLGRMGEEEGVWLLKTASSI